MTSVVWRSVGERERGECLGEEQVTTGVHTVKMMPWGVHGGWGQETGRDKSRAVRSTWKE